MAYYTDLFSPETYEAFSESSRDISGFRKRQQNAASQIHPGDKLVCYVTKVSRWIGVLEVTSDFFINEAPLFYPEDDPFVVRFRVRPIVCLTKEKAVPIHQDHIWDSLSFTKGHDKGSSTWTGKMRNSLNPLTIDDGRFLEELLQSQQQDGEVYELDEDKYQKLVTQRVRRPDKVVRVSVPQEDDEQEEIAQSELTIRESYQMQALLAQIGETMGFTVWLPKRDRTSVLQEWQPDSGTLLDILPLNYDETTLRTIEQIDVIWLRRRSIVRAFEVEHTTAIYSGILRMADLLALQPNMDIKLHIVAPYGRKEKVLQEIQRPVFSLLDRAPLSEICSFISYDSLRELLVNKHLSYLSDAVIEEYTEESE